MRTSFTLAQYLRNGAPAVVPSRPRSSAPFVTISREAGAGGHAFAAALQARFSKEKDALFLGWQVFDRNLCERVAADPGLNVSLESLLDEESHAGLDDYLRSVLAHRSPQSKIDHHLFRTVRGVCSRGKAIVIGRAAAFVTRGLPLGVRVRLVAPRRSRVDRIRRETGLGAEAARRSVDQKDSRRARLVKTYFGKGIADPLLYDCVWNTDAASFEAIAESVVALIRRRVARGPRS